MADRPEKTQAEPVAEHQRQRLVGYAIGVAVMLLLALVPAVEVLDLKILDTQFQLQRGLEPRPVQKDVVLIGFDEGTYTANEEPFALWHKHFADAFRALAIAKPGVVGLDFALPSKSYNKVIKGIDQELLHGIRALRKVAPMVFGKTVLRDKQQRHIYAPYIAVAGKQSQAFVLWRLDADRVVRHFYPRLANTDKTLPTLVAAMAEQLGVAPREGLIDFALGPAFEYIPLQEVIRLAEDGEHERLKSLFAGKPVLFGQTLPFEDRHYQPVNLAAWEHDNKNYVPGVLIHAQALRSLLNDRLITKTSSLIVYLGIVALSLLWWLNVSISVSAALFSLVFVILWSIQFLLLQQGFHLPIAAMILAGMIALGGRKVMDTGYQLLERHRLRKVFNGYASPQVVNEILEGRIEPGTKGNRMNMCVMFSDIRDFTTFSEKMEPETVVEILNRYLGAMTEAIHEHDGTVVDFMGDGIMAVFGAPNTLASSAKNAFEAAQKKLERLSDFNRELDTEYAMPGLRIGIGIHLGDAVVGNIGSEQRYQYTAIGDVINTASRIEGLTKKFGYPVVVSKEVADTLRGIVPLDDLGDAEIKGRAPVHVFGWPPKPEQTS